MKTIPLGAKFGLHGQTYQLCRINVASVKPICITGTEFYSDESLLPHKLKYTQAEIKKCLMNTYDYVFYLGQKLDNYFSLQVGDTVEYQNKTWTIVYCESTKEFFLCCNNQLIPAKGIVECST